MDRGDGYNLLQECNNAMKNNNYTEKSIVIFAQYKTEYKTYMYNCCIINYTDFDKLIDDYQRVLKMKAFL